MSISNALGNKLLKLGSQGDVVRQVQLALRQLGYPLSGTGFFGNATDTAVTAFQRSQRLNADGVVGPATVVALDAALAARLSVPGGPQSPLERPLEVGRPLWLQAGLALLGTHEGPGAKDNSVIIDWAREEGGDVAAEYTHDSIPWCALFMNHIFTKASLKGTETLWALDWAGHWPSIRLAAPAVGAVAPMLRSGGGHVICIVGRSSSGRVVGLGGNQSDAVSLAEFPLSRLNKGFWWPAGVPLPAGVGFNKLPLVDSSGKVSTNEA